MSRLGYDALEAAWQALPASPTSEGRVVHLVMRHSVSQLAKRDRPPGYNVLRSPYHTEPRQVTLDPVEGIVGDRWSPEKNNPGDQISLTNIAVTRLITNGDPARFHLTGDNFIVDFDVTAKTLPVGTKLAIGTAVIEITEDSYRPCNRYEARFGKDARRWADDPIHVGRHIRGRYAKVVSGGTVELGASITRVG